MRRVLIIGATGQFGSRLADRLARIEGIELMLASRSAERAQEIARTIAAKHPTAKITAVTIDRKQNPERAIQRLNPWLVIDASGPFQTAGYDAARAAIRAGAHWIDLADARDYILDFTTALDEMARAHGVVALAGASSTPALSTAVATELTKSWRRVDTIDIAILPGGNAPVGEAVIQALLSSMGQRVEIWQKGKRDTAWGWTTANRVRLPEIGVRYLSHVETADASILPGKLVVKSRVTFRAGLESRLEHFGLLILARLKRRGWIKKMEPLVPWLARGRGLTRLLSNGRGGMLVDAAGIDGEGRQRVSEWLLTSRKGDGGFVPVLPAAALTRMLLSITVAPGARLAGDALCLGAIETEMAELQLSVSKTFSAGDGRGLFEEALGPEKYATLPKALRDFHDPDGAAVWSGRADIDSGKSLPAKLARLLFGFPHSARDIPVCVTVDRNGKNEFWSRDFSGERFASLLTPSSPGQVAETFLAFKIHMKLEAVDGTIRMPVVHWQIGLLPLPRFLAPRSEVREYVDELGRFRFDVRISAPGIGLIAHYRGWLEAVTSNSEIASTIA